MPDYQLRITRPYSHVLEASINVIAAFGGSIEWLIYEHEADEQVSRTHVHCYIFGWAYTHETFRKRFREQYEDLAKTDFAISTHAGRERGPVTINGAVRYASKNGTIHFKKCQGFNEETITKMEESFKTETVPAVRMIRKGIQMKRYDQVMSLMEHIAEETKRVNENLTYKRELWPGEVYDVICRWAREHGQTLTEYRILELLTTIRVYNGDTDTMRDRILKKIGE